MNNRKDLTVKDLKNILNVLDEDDIILIPGYYFDYDNIDYDDSDYGPPILEVANNVKKIKGLINVKKSEITEITKDTDIQTVMSSDYKLINAITIERV